VAFRRLVYGLSTLLAACLLTVSCSPERAAGAQPPTRTSASQAIGFAAPVASACGALPAQTPLAEVKGSRLWALVFGPVPIRARTETKIVWRMGGHGAFSIGAKTTGGSSAQLTFGPELHDGSTWNVPNTDEWGTGFIFPTAGCWRVHAGRDGATGDVYLLVVD